MSYGSGRKDMQFSHAVGYRGLCKLRDNYLLCTGGSINLTQDPIMGSGVWGAGYKVASPIAYAWNYLQTQGSANFELTDGGEIESLKAFVNNDRTSKSSIQLLPDGVNGFKGSGWFSQISFQASQGSAITGSFGFKGDPAPADTTQGIIANQPQASGADAADSNLANNLAGATLFPYWDTYIQTSGDGYEGGYGYDDAGKMNDIISWNVSGNSDLQLLKCCGGLESGEKAPLNADYILAGELSGDASLTVFKIRGQFVPEQYHQPLTKMKFYLNSGRREGNYGDKHFISFPQLIINSASTSMTNGASYVTAQFSYTALGDGKNALFGIDLEFQK